MKRIIGIVLFAGLLGCGGQLQHLAVETLENAQVTLAAAEASGAPETHTAQELLTGATAAMEAGDTERAYRLALRAYLHARIATETAHSLQLEVALQEAEAQLAVNQQRAAETRQALTELQKGLSLLKKPRHRQRR